MSLLQGAETQFQALTRSARGEELVFREKAWREYQRLGLPGRKTESWKYSSLTGFMNKSWSEPKAETSVFARALTLRERWQSTFDVIVIQNGKVLDSTASMTADWGHAPAFDDGFSGMSAALSQPGVNLHINGRAARPIMIIHALSGDAVWSKSLHQVRVATRTGADIVEWFIGEGANLRSDLMNVKLEEGAHVNWVRIQDEASSASHFSDYKAALLESSSLNLTQIQCGSRWSRSTLTADIRGRNAEARFAGLTFASGQQHVDQRVVVNHWAPHSASAQLFKGVLKDRANGIVNGRIFIAKDAQKVQSSQLNHNLLLTPGAEANTKPELEIYADDVKANHGASIGRMDEDKLFYLESRGIRRTEAMQMLARAFVGDVLMKITPQLRPVCDEALNHVLPEFAAQMEQGL